MKSPAKIIMGAGKLLLVVGLAVTVCGGLGGTVLGMIRAFGDAASPGQAGAEELAGTIGRSLKITATGLSIVFGGLCLFVAGVAGRSAGKRRFSIEPNDEVE